MYQDIIDLVKKREEIEKRLGMKKNSGHKHKLTVL